MPEKKEPSIVMDDEDKIQPAANKEAEKAESVKGKGYLLKSDLWYDGKLLETGSRNSLSKLKKTEIDKLIDKDRIE